MGDVFKALADPTRRAIMDELSGKDGQSLFEICTSLITNHDMGSTRQAISQHLTVLEEAGLIATRRQGRYKFHHLDTSPLREIAERWPIQERRMRINLASVFVDDQVKALAFYTDVLGFLEKTNIPMGEHSWLTVVSPSDPEGVELVLEPGDHPAVRPFKDALVADGIPFTSFTVDDVDAEYRRLVDRGVVFVQQPTALGPVTVAVFDDTCGNLIQIASTL